MRPLLGLAAMAIAVKGDLYNPFRHRFSSNETYWRDSADVLNDLDQFSTLSIRYHSCAWSTIYGDTESEEGEEDDGNYDNAWYKGMVPYSGANVAFELYGTLKGSSTIGCNRKTYINSFYTTGGFVSLTSVMGWSVNDQYDGGCYGKTKVGCNGGDFAELMYDDQYCDPETVVGVIDKLTDLNGALGKLDCVEVYSARSQEGDDEEAQDEATETIEAILQYSTSCIFEGGSSCPDPYGKLSRWHQKLPMEIYDDQVRAGKIMLIVGVALLLVVLTILLVRPLDPKAEERKRRKRKLRSALKKKMHSLQSQSTEDDGNSTDGQTNWWPSFCVRESDWKPERTVQFETPPPKSPTITDVRKQLSFWKSQSQTMPYKDIVRSERQKFGLGMASIVKAGAATVQTPKSTSSDENEDSLDESEEEETMETNRTVETLEDNDSSSSVDDNVQSCPDICDQLALWQRQAQSMPYHTLVRSEQQKFGLGLASLVMAGAATIKHNQGPSPTTSNDDDDESFEESIDAIEAARSMDTRSILLVESGVGSGEQDTMSQAESADDDTADDTHQPYLEEPNTTLESTLDGTWRHQAPSSQSSASSEETDPVPPPPRRRSATPPRRLASHARTLWGKIRRKK